MLMTVRIEHDGGEQERTTMVERSKWWWWRREHGDSEVESKVIGSGDLWERAQRQARRRGSTTRIDTLTSLFLTISDVIKTIAI